MGIVVRQSVKSTLVTNVGFAIGTINVLFLSTALLSADELGLYRVIMEIAVFFAAFSQLGLPQMIDRYFSVFKEKNKESELLAFVLIYPLVGLTLYLTYFFLFGSWLMNIYVEKSPLLSENLHFIIPLVGIVAYNNVLESYSRSNLRIVVPTLIRDIYLRLTNTVVIILYGLNIISLNEFLQMFVLANLSASILLVSYLFKLGVLRIGPLLKMEQFRSFLKDDEFFGMIKYGLYIILGTLGVVISTKIDLFMLPAFTDLTSTGIYAIALYMGAVVEIPKKSLTQISIPILTKAIHNERWNEVKILYQKTGLNQLVIGLFIFVCIWINFDSIFTLIPNSETYNSGRMVIVIIGITKLIDMSCGLSAEIISYSKYYRFTMIIMILLSFLTVGTNFWLIPIYGIYGAATATALSIFVFTLIKVVFNQVKFGLHPFTKGHAAPIAMAIIAFGAVYLLPQFNDSILEATLTIIYRTLVIILIYGMGIYFSKVSVEVNNLVNMGFGHLRRRLPF